MTGGFGVKSRRKSVFSGPLTIVGGLVVVLVLAWNFAESIIAKHRQYAGTNGRFIVPLPDLTLVNLPGIHPLSNINHGPFILQNLP